MNILDQIANASEYRKQATPEQLEALDQAVASMARELTTILQQIRETPTK